MGVVVDPSPGGEKVAEQPALQRISVITQPSGQGGVDSEDSAVGSRDEVTAGTIVPKVFQDCVGHADRTKAEIVDAVASGALTCGQWPVASRVISRLSGTCSWT